ncbi:MAG: tyrosine-type recombinase/integrase [Acutalibacteraceae bacterium]
MINKTLIGIVNKYNESPAAEKSGVFLSHFSVRTFRRTFAARMFESGVDPKVTQAILGRSSLNMTLNVYTQIFPTSCAKKAYQNWISTSQSLHQFYTN